MACTKVIIRPKWFKTFQVNLAINFPNCSEHLLQSLLEMLNNEVVSAVSGKGGSVKLKTLFETVQNLFLHLYWKIQWKSKKTWTKCSEMEFLKTSNDFRIKYIAKLLYFIINIGMVLSKGISASQWINRILDTVYILHDYSIVYTSLLMVRNIKKKYLHSYSAILKKILIIKFPNCVLDPVDYIKVMMLLKRLKKYSEEAKEKQEVLSAILKYQAPSELIPWMSSFNLDVSKVKQKTIAQQLFKKSCRDLFQKLEQLVMDFESPLCEEKSKDNKLVATDIRLTEDMDSLHSSDLKTSGSESSERKKHETKDKNKKQKSKSIPETELNLGDTFSLAINKNLNSQVDLDSFHSSKDIKTEKNKGTKRKKHKTEEKGMKKIRKSILETKVNSGETDSLTINENINSQVNLNSFHSSKYLETEENKSPKMKKLKSKNKRSKSNPQTEISLDKSHSLSIGVKIASQVDLNSFNSSKVLKIEENKNTQVQKHETKSKKKLRQFIPETEVNLGDTNLLSIGKNIDSLVDLNSCYSSKDLKPEENKSGKKKKYKPKKKKRKSCPQTEVVESHSLATSENIASQVDLKSIHSSKDLKIEVNKSPKMKHHEPKKKSKKKQKRKSNPKSLVNLHEIDSSSVSEKSNETDTFNFEQFFQKLKSNSVRSINNTNCQMSQMHSNAEEVSEVNEPDKITSLTSTADMNLAQDVNALQDSYNLPKEKKLHSETIISVPQACEKSCEKIVAQDMDMAAKIHDYDGAIMSQYPGSTVIGFAPDSSADMGDTFEGNNNSIQVQNNLEDACSRDDEEEHALNVSTVSEVCEKIVEDIVVKEQVYPHEASIFYDRCCTPLLNSFLELSADTAKSDSNNFTQIRSDSSQGATISSPQMSASGEAGSRDENDSNAVYEDFTPSNHLFKDLVNPSSQITTDYLNLCRDNPGVTREEQFNVVDNSETLKQLCNIFNSVTNWISDSNVENVPMQRISCFGTRFSDSPNLEESGVMCKNTVTVNANEFTWPQGEDMLHQSANSTCDQNTFVIDHDIENNVSNLHSETVLNNSDVSSIKLIINLKNNNHRDNLFLQSEPTNSFPHLFCISQATGSPSQVVPQFNACSSLHEDIHTITDAHCSRKDFSLCQPEYISSHSPTHSSPCLFSVSQKTRCPSQAVPQFNACLLHDDNRRKTFGHFSREDFSMGQPESLFSRSLTNSCPHHFSMSKQTESLSQALPQFNTCSSLHEDNCRKTVGHCSRKDFTESLCSHTSANNPHLFSVSQKTGCASQAAHQFNACSSLHKVSHAETDRHYSRKDFSIGQPANDFTSTKKRFISSKMYRNSAADFSSDESSTECHSKVEFPSLNNVVTSISNYARDHINKYSKLCKKPLSSKRRTSNSFKKAKVPIKAKTVKDKKLPRETVKSPYNLRARESIGLPSKLNECLVQKI